MLVQILDKVLNINRDSPSYNNDNPYNNILNSVEVVSLRTFKTDIRKKFISNKRTKQQQLLVSYIIFLLFYTFYFFMISNTRCSKSKNCNKIFFSKPCYKQPFVVNYFSVINFESDLNHWNKVCIEIKHSQVSIILAARRHLGIIWQLVGISILYSLLSVV